MNKEQIHVLNLLRSHKKRGLTAQHVNRGYALRSRIAELRAMNFEIDTVLKKNAKNSGRHGVYFLRSERR